MIKYGIENFSFEVIEECEKEKLNDREIYWISFYNSNNKNYGYNATKGGECFSNTRFTEKEILEIYDLLRKGISQIEIAKRYNVA